MKLQVKPRNAAMREGGNAEERFEGGREGRM